MPLEHTLDPQPTVYEEIPFIWGFGDAWSMLQGYAGLLLDRGRLMILLPRWKYIKELSKWCISTAYGISIQKGAVAHTQTPCQTFEKTDVMPVMHYAICYKDHWRVWGTRYVCGKFKDVTCLAKNVWHVCVWDLLPQSGGRRLVLCLELYKWWQSAMRRY